MRLTTREWLPSRRRSAYDPERAPFGLRVNHVLVRLVPVRPFSPPNNSLKLTRRAAFSGMLVLPAGEAHNPGGSARFRRAA